MLTHVHSAVTRLTKLPKGQVRAQPSVALRVALVLAMLAGGRHAAWADLLNEHVEKCMDAKASVDLRLHHCSLVIQSGQLSGQNLANALYVRGHAY